MILNVLIATYGQGLLKLPQLLHSPCPNVRYIISCQQAINNGEIPEALCRPDVHVFFADSTGIAANRNHGLDCLMHIVKNNKEQEELVWLLDDDVTILSTSFKQILNVFKANPEVDLACFQITTPEGIPYHTYADHANRMIGIESVRAVSSIEIVFRYTKIQAVSLRFDERFGLGRQWPSSEEFLFRYQGF